MYRGDVVAGRRLDVPRSLEAERLYGAAWYTHTKRVWLTKKIHSTWKFLKEHCHEDFAVLGQFCAKIITLRL